MVDLRTVDGCVFDQLIYLHPGSFQLLVKICGYEIRGEDHQFLGIEDLGR